MMSALIFNGVKKEGIMNSRRRLMERKVVEELVCGKGFNAICRDLKIGRNRVRHIREKAREYGYLDGSKSIPVYPEALFPDPVDGRSLKKSELDLELEKHKGWIKDRLEAGWQPITVYEELPVSVGRSSYYRFLHRHRLIEIGSSSRRGIIQEIIYEAGEALIVDWGKLADVKTDGERKVLWMFVGIMGHSRYLMVRLVWSHDVMTTLSSLEDMLKELGGVPKKIISDNPKCFCLKACKYEPLLNPVYERFASHYGLIIECLPPRSPELKGKVERMMPFVRRLYQAHKDKWEDISESESYLNKKISIANERIHGTTRKRPIDLLLEEESPRLKALPGINYEVEEFHEGKVRRDSHCRFRHKYYSVSEEYIGEEVAVIGNSKLISIYHKGKLIEVHKRITDPCIFKNTKPQHLNPWQRSIQDGSYYRERAAKLGRYTEQVILKLLLDGQGFIDTRKIWGILSLDKKYSAEAINEACRQAISIGSYSYRTILMFINITPVKKETDEEVSRINNKIQSSKFVRSIKEYQQLH